VNEGGCFNKVVFIWLGQGVHEGLYVTTWSVPNMVFTIKKEMLVDVF
jgi:hypothetical protein